MKKIMFNDQYNLTDAVLKKTKTMTRRLVNFPPGDLAIFNSMTPAEREALTPVVIDRYSNYQVGDEVAIAMMYYLLEDNYKRNAYVRRKMQAEGLTFKKLHEEQGCWNKMFVRADLMPWRIVITDVRIERLQDISYQDALREGIELSPDGKFFVQDLSYRIHRCWSQLFYFDRPQDAFKKLICRMYNNKLWEDNPWVFVYSFKLKKS